ncbi:MAG TPA: hypothetical protein VFW47_03330 [Phenylobacterium sp.]|nr:hypothetical protein [Phenylobacterium sp.]
MADHALGRRDAEAAYNLALVNYALLFASIFFAGVPGLIAAIIAYSQRDEAPSDVRSHMNFQIRIFWVAFGLSLAAGLCAIGAAIRAVRDLVGISARHPVESYMGVTDITLDLSRLSVDGMVVALLAGFILFSGLAAAWLVGAPAVGFIRLASQRGIGHSAAA